MNQRQTFLRVVDIALNPVDCHVADSRHVLAQHVQVALLQSSLNELMMMAVDYLLEG